MAEREQEAGVGDADVAVAAHRRLVPVVDDVAGLPASASSRTTPPGSTAPGGGPPAGCRRCRRPPRRSGRRSRRARTRRATCRPAGPARPGPRSGSRFHSARTIALPVVRAVAPALRVLGADVEERPPQLDRGPPVRRARSRAGTCPARSARRRAGRAPRSRSPAGRAPRRGRPRPSPAGVAPGATRSRSPGSAARTSARVQAIRVALGHLVDQPARLRRTVRRGPGRGQGRTGHGDRPRLLAHVLGRQVDHEQGVGARPPARPRRRSARPCSPAPPAGGRRGPAGAAAAPRPARAPRARPAPARRARPCGTVLARRPVGGSARWVDLRRGATAATAVREATR